MKITITELAQILSTCPQPYQGLYEQWCEEMSEQGSEPDPIAFDLNWKMNYVRNILLMHKDINNPDLTSIEDLLKNKGE